MQESLELKSTCSRLILRHLRSCSNPFRHESQLTHCNIGSVAAPATVPKMHYESFHEQITMRHHIIYQNWPVTFGAPADLGNVEVRTLHDYLENEDAPPLFRKLDDDEFKSFEKAFKRGKARREEEGEDDEGDEDEVDLAELDGDEGGDDEEDEGEEDGGEVDGGEVDGGEDEGHEGEGDGVHHTGQNNEQQRVSSELKSCVLRYSHASLPCNRIFHLLSPALASSKAQLSR